MKKHKTAFSVLILLIVGFGLWFYPHPSGVSPLGWRMLSLFITTVIGIILKPLPMSAIAMIALTFAVSSQTISITDALIGFGNEVVWLVVFAFFISRGFIATGLGSRIAYKIISIFGKHSLGLGYGLVLTDLILAPTIPSVTARVGGVIYPILKSIADIFTGSAHDPKMGAFLIQAVFQGSMITSAMFLTSMAGNPLVAELARGQGIEITWLRWMLAAIVPGLLSLILVPYFLFRLAPPTIRKTPHAHEMAIKKLKQIGPMQWKEWVMLASFFLLIVLWIFGPYIGMKAVVAAMIGLSILLMTKIIQWKDVLEESGAWDALIWFSVLITFASILSKLGVIAWFSASMIDSVKEFHWQIGFGILSLFYFYSHYFFASCIAHISAMYTPLLVISIAIGTPPELAALSLGFFSSLMGALTHYGAGQAPILFSAGYMTTTQWWGKGLLCSFVNIGIWTIFGGLWWKFLGLW